MENTILDKDQRATKDQESSAAAKVENNDSHCKKQMPTTSSKFKRKNVVPIIAGAGAGIILGTAGAYAMSADEVQDDNMIEPTNDNVLRATSVNDDMTFNEAFAAARTEVGAGGVFEWNGKVYGTYYKDEWDSMSAEDKVSYSSKIEPYLGPSNATTDDNYNDSENESITSEGLSDDEVAIEQFVDSEQDVAVDDSNAIDDNLIVEQSTTDNFVEVEVNSNGDVLIPDEDLVSLEDNDVFDEIEVLGVDDAEPSLYAEDQEIFLIEVDGSNDIEYVAMDSTPEDIDQYTSDTDLMSMDDIDYMQDINDYDLA